MILVDKLIDQNAACPATLIYLFYQQSHILYAHIYPHILLLPQCESTT